MNPQQEIDELQKKIEQLKKLQENCRHKFDEPIFDPEKVMEGYGIKTVGHGSDVYSEYSGYHEVSKNRWSRACKICGIKQYTYHQEVVISKYSYTPKF